MVFSGHAIHTDTLKGYLNSERWPALEYSCCQSEPRLGLDAETNGDNNLNAEWGQNLLTDGDKTSLFLYVVPKALLVIKLMVEKLPPRSYAHFKT
jgi:hypothetical protein